MSDEELLKRAEEALQANNTMGDVEAHQANSLNAIAAALLVIARNAAFPPMDVKADDPL